MTTSSRPLLALGFAAFLVFGVVLVLVGANQPAIARDLGLDLERSGLLVSGLALGVGIGVVSAGPLVDRYPRRPLFVAASLLMAGALGSFEADMSFARAFGQVALAGLALGIHETVLNASVTQVYAERAARPVILVHTAVTVGAMLTPPAIGWLAASAPWTASFRATGAVYLALAAAALLAPFPAPQGRGPSGHAPLRSVLAPAIAPFALVGFAYVGVETTLTLFAVPYADDTLELSRERGLAAISAFWLGLLGGRVALLAVRSRIDERFLLGAGLLGALVLALGVGAALPAPELVLAASGFALGVVFPVMIALAAERFPEARGTATGLVAGAAALGGFAVPWLHGALGDRAGLQAALGALAVWPLVIAAAAWSAGRGLPR